ncbi:hypothetical protein H6F88_17530 [Oculatella sp. FACHB-28]|uniref:hypothetical protein n=1 Tax=Oculatella sp. FACHB-28 TaxID=2692845 RepID=UPI0016877EC2|nr:hypothetical protein [Oculatella sp. FACHB-28]MBD2057799.1 hypothetical protein [Oculatella sp. FACHB-28]
MFLVKDTSSTREERIKQFLADEPALAALLAVIHFEWTIRRAIIALGTSPNVVVRQKLERCHGHQAYKDLWKEEVALIHQAYLPTVVKNWQGLHRAFKLRHTIVHGANSCSSEHAAKRVEWAMAAAQDVREFCTARGINLDTRLPIRQRKKSVR